MAEVFEALLQPTAPRSQSQSIPSNSSTVKTKKVSLAEVFQEGCLGFRVFGLGCWPSSTVETKQVSLAERFQGTRRGKLGPTCTRFKNSSGSMHWKFLISWSFIFKEYL